jgi:hypothetical protein
LQILRFELRLSGDEAGRARAFFWNLSRRAGSILY